MLQMQKMKHYFGTQMIMIVDAIKEFWYLIDTLTQDGPNFRVWLLVECYAMR